MGQRSKVEGTKIAQVAKDLNVTSVTIRRYLAEFHIRTATDENGIKVLPPTALDELLEVRRLKEEGLTNPKVLEILAEKRALRKVRGADDMEEEEQTADIELESGLEDSDLSLRNQSEGESIKDSETDNTAPQSEGEDDTSLAKDGRVKHALTCQTCGKPFEHTNPRLRDCLDCYRTKRKERRRGGDKHKHVIQHPLAQQVANKTAQLENQTARNGVQEDLLEAVSDSGNGKSHAHSEPIADNRQPVNMFGTGAVPAIQRGGAVRNYRKAIEETRQITGSLKRRLERPDLPEAERRWLEQVYAYQLILHQGWRHLSEYKSATVSQNRTEE